MSVLIDDTAGVSETTGTADYVISGPLGDYNPIVGSLVNGTEYTYRAGFSNGTTAGRELGTGIWNSGSNTLTRVTIISGTNGVSKVNWAAGEKYVYIVGDAASINSMEHKTETATAKVMTNVERDKLDNIDVTQPVDLDAMEAGIVTNAADIAQNTSDIADLGGFPHLAPGDPVRVLVFGDSNISGPDFGNPSVQSPNASVFIYATLGVAPWSTSNLEWRNVDPNASVILDAPGSSQPYIGIYRNGNGSTGFGLANRIQERTGRDTYLYVTSLGGTTINYWQTGGGVGAEGMTSINANVGNALADISGLGGSTFFDVVLVGTSTNDADQDIFGAEFLSKFQATYDHLVASGWVDPNVTQTFLTEPSQNYGAYINKKWDGLQFVDNNTSERVKVLSSFGLPDVGDNTHFTAESDNQYGIYVADAAIIGPTPKHYLRNRSYVEQLNPVIAGDVVSGKTAALSLFTEKKGVDDELPNDVTLGAQSAHDDATVGNRDGGALTLKGGDGALNQNGTGGDIILDGGLGFGSGAKGYVLLGNSIQGMMNCFTNVAGEATTALYTPVVNCWAGGGAISTGRGVTIDLATGKITVLRSGTYYCYFQASFTGLAGATFQFALFEDTSGFIFGPVCEAKMNGSSDINSVSCAGFKYFTAGQKLVCKHLSPTAAVTTIKHGGLGMARIGN